VFHACLPPWFPMAQTILVLWLLAHTTGRPCLGLTLLMGFRLRPIVEIWLSRAVFT
jgi:hypothetical protein